MIMWFPRSSSSLFLKNSSDRICKSTKIVTLHKAEQKRQITFMKFIVLPITEIHSTDLPFWKPLLKDGSIILDNIKWVVGDGSCIDAMHDIWISGEESSPPCLHFMGEINTPLSCLCH